MSLDLGTVAAPEAAPAAGVSVSVVPSGPMPGAEAAGGSTVALGVTVVAGVPVVAVATGAAAAGRR
ncbi:hypothetical protein [Actinacidiphila acididurans]|uniref:Uncharacterized protein n=1 Tax=Actinacidiphila acididurans TaxID=2784346 RepID=A0ABS2TIZ9_9ACTN|nr:hypothetical protein [Actinacidiphila acididurans]MBM9503320.1 hypothetical protein [Actinacidiphila acididurans]